MAEETKKNGSNLKYYSILSTILTKFFKTIINTLIVISQIKNSAILFSVLTPKGQNTQEVSPSVDPYICE